MNDRLLKRLILKEIHSVLNEGEEAGDSRRYEVLLNDIDNKIADAEKLAPDERHKNSLNTLGIKLRALLDSLGHNEDDEGVEEEPSGKYEPEYFEDEDMFLEESRRKKIRRR